MDLYERLDRYKGNSLITKIRYFAEERLQFLRSLTHSSQEIINYGSIVLNKTNETLTVNEESISLSLGLNPVKLLILFMENPQRLFSYEDIAQKIGIKRYADVKSLGDEDRDYVLEELKEATHKLRDEVTRVLRERGMSKQNVSYLSQTIIPSKNIGWKFIPPRHNMAM